MIEKNAKLKASSNRYKAVDLEKQLVYLFSQAELSMHKTMPKTAKNPNEGTNSLLATQFLSRHGFKNPNDIALYLKSPAGDSTKKEIKEELAAIAALYQQQKQLYDDKNRRHRLLALLLLYFLKKKSAKAQELNHLIQQDIDQQLKSEKEIILKKQQASQSSAFDKTPSLVAKMIVDLNHEIILTETDVLALNGKKKILMDKLSRLRIQHNSHKTALNKHNLRLDQLHPQEANINQIEYFLKQEAAKTTGSENTPLMNYRNALNSEEAIIIKRNSELVDLFNNLDDVTALKKAQSSHNLNLEQHEFSDEDAVIQALKSKMQEYALQLGEINDRISVASAKAVYCDFAGNIVGHISKAELVLPLDEYQHMKKHQLRFEKHNGQFYALKEGQEFSKLDEGQKLEARNQCLKLKPEERICVSTLLGHNYELNAQPLKEQLNHTEIALKGKIEHVAQLNVQLSHTLKKQSSCIQLTHKFRDAITIIKENQQSPSQELINALQTTLTLKSSELFKQELMKLKPGVAINPIVLKRLQSDAISIPIMNALVNALSGLKNNKSPLSMEPCFNPSPFKK